MIRASGLRIALSPLLLAGLAAAQTACGGGRSKAQPTETLPERITTTQQTAETPYSTRFQPIVVQQGTAPLVYLVESEGTLAFIDLDTNQTLGQAVVKPRQIVQIDAKRGIRVGEETIRTGPLPAEHRYGISLLPDSTSTLNTTTVRPIAPSRQH